MFEILTHGLTNRSRWRHDVRDHHCEAPTAGCHITTEISASVTVRRVDVAAQLFRIGDAQVFLGRF